MVKRVAILSVALLLAGCSGMISTVNIASINKSASSNGLIPNPHVQCVALESGFNIKTAMAQQKAIEHCEVEAAEMPQQPTPLLECTALAGTMSYENEQQKAQAIHNCVEVSKGKSPYPAPPAK